MSRIRVGAGYANQNQTPKSHTALEAEIAERKRAEKSLQESEARYRAVLEDTPVLICRFLPDGEISYVNQAYCEYFKKTREELIGNSFLMLIPEADREAVMKKIHALNVDSPVQSHEHHVIVPNGTIRWQRWTNRALFDREGNVTAYQSIGEDISERKEAEMALVEKNIQSQSLLNLSKELERAQTYADISEAALKAIRDIVGYQRLVIHLISADKKEATIISAQGAFAHELSSEFPYIPIKGDPFLEHLLTIDTISVVEDARTDPRTNKEIVTALELRTAVNVPIVLMDRHIGIFHTGTYGDEGIKVPSESEADYLMTMATHVAVALDRVFLSNERKQAEEALQETNASLEEMVYIASHDLQTPLLSMEGFAGEVLNNYRDTLDEQGVHQLERIQANTRRMRKLVLSLLDMSRLNTVKNPYATFSAGDVVDNVLRDLALTIEQAGAIIDVDDLPRMYGDKQRIEGVFRRLISNALTYRGKHITIGCKDGAYVVRDDGIGIYADQLQKIFKPGEQLKDITIEGAGMGLTLCQKVIAQHHGRIWAESEGVGKGAAFYFEITTDPSKTILPTEHTEKRR